MVDYNDLKNKVVRLEANPKKFFWEEGFKKVFFSVGTHVGHTALVELEDGTFIDTHFGIMIDRDGNEEPITDEARHAVCELFRPFYYIEMEGEE